MKDYTIEQIFQKELYFLIPFYLFNHESQFKKIDTDPEKIEHLKDEYRTIVTRLDDAIKNEKLTVYSGKTIIEMAGKVTEALAAKYSNIKEGVKSVMGGKVLDYEAKQILNQGRAEGRVEGEAKGRVEGEAKGRLKTLFELVQNSMISLAAAAGVAGMSEGDFLRKMNEAAAGA